MLTGKPTPPLKARTNGFRVSLLAGAVAGALSLALSQTAFASDQNLGVPTIGTPVAIGDDLSLATVSDVKHPENSVDALVYGSVITGNIAESLNVNAQFGQADLEAVLRTEGFGDFGVAGEDGKGFDVSWLTGAVVLNNTADTLTVNNASVSATAAGVSDNPYLEVAGMAQYNGAVQFTGESTTISASSDLQMRADPDEESVVYGYIIENPIGQADQKRSATFSADKTSISASSTGSNGVDVIGVHFSADAADVPAITFAGKEATVTATNESRNQWAYGVFMHNSDGDREGTNATVTVNEGTSLTITAKGGEAVGLYADDGKFVSNGTLTISAEGLGDKVTAGIYALGNANLTFNGKTDVTATGSDAYALVVKYAEKIPEGMQTADDADAFPTRDHFGVTFAGETTLNGAVLVDKDMTVTMNGTTTVNGGLELSGTIDGTGSLTIDAKQATGTIAEGASIHQNSLTFLNGTFASAGNVQATTITIGDGATYKDSGDLNASDKIVLAQGGVYQSSDNETTMLHDNDKVELAGGKFVNANGETFSNWQLVTNAGGQYSANAVLSVVQGDYTFSNFTIGEGAALEVAGGALHLTSLQKDAEASAGGSLTVTGGSLTAKSMDLTDVTGTITGGSVEVGTLKVATANGLTIGGTDGTASLTVNDKITDVASGIIIGVNGTLATNVGTIGFKDLDEGYEVSDDFNTVSVAAGGTMRVEGFDGVSLSIGELAQLKNKLAGSDSQGLLDLVGDIAITDLTITDGKVTASDVEKLGNTTTSALKEATVTEVDNSGVTGSFKAVELAEGTNKLSVTSSSGALTLNGSAEGGNLVSDVSGETETAAGISVVRQVATLGNSESANKGTVAGVSLGGSATVNVVGTTGAEFSLGTVTAVEDSADNVVNVLGATAQATEIGGSVDVNIGSSDVAGHVEVEKLTTSGLIFLDPAWKGDDKIEDGSFLTAADVAANGELNAQIVVGQNSTVAIGATKDEVVESFAQTGLRYGQDGVTAVFYAQKAITLSDTGAILVNGDLTEAPEAGEVTAGSFHVTKNGLAVIDGDAIGVDTVAITASTITFDEGSHIRVVGLGEDKMSGQLFSATSLTIDQTVLDDAKTNSGIYSLEIKEDGSFTAEEIAAADAFPTFKGVRFLEALRGVGLDEDAADTTQAFLSRLNYHQGMTAKQASDIGNQAMALAATAGVYNVALDSSKLMNRSLERRMTLADNFDRTKGLTVWADVFGTTNQADSLYGDGGYDMDLYGGVLGADVEVVPGAVLGAALTVGTGDGGSKDAAIDVDNDADFFGLSVYGSHRIGNCNGMIDIGWMHTKSDLSATAFGMSIGDEVKADAFTIGFGAEHLMKFGSVNVVPHVGIRWTRLDVDGYEGAFKTDDDTMNIFTLPIGVAFSGNLNAGAWKLAPAVDLAVVPSFGDDEAESKVSWQGISETVKTQVVDDAPFQASLGINAQNGNWTIGASYDLGVGGDDRLDNAFSVRARYAF